MGVFNWAKRNFKIQNYKRNLTTNKFREFEVDFSNFTHDLNEEKEEIKFSDLELIFKDLKSLFKKKGYIINWNQLEKQSLDETLNALAMASPFSLEEKQILLEAESLDKRKNKISQILKTYLLTISTIKHFNNLEFLKNKSLICYFNKSFI